MEEKLTNATNKPICVFWLGTGIYSKFFNEIFFESLKNLFPKEKIIIKIISDSLKEYEGYNDGHIIDTQVIYIPDMPYPIVPMLKYEWVEKNLDDSFDTFLYFDADSQIIERGGDFWDRLNNIMKDNVIFSADYYYHKNCKEGSDLMNNDDYIKNYGSLTLTLNSKLPSSVPQDWYEKLIYVRTSFFGGNCKHFKLFAERAHDILKQTLNFKSKKTLTGNKVSVFQKEWIPFNRYIDPAFDETIANKIILENITSKKINIATKKFIFNKWFKPTGTFYFVKQKEWEEKKPKKYGFE